MSTPQWSIRNNDRLLGMGDSQMSTSTGVLGDMLYAPGGFVDQLHATSIQFSKTPTNTLYVPSRIGQPIPAGYKDLQQTGRNQLVMRYGVGGRTIAGLDGDMQASFYVFKPDVAIVVIGTNDFAGGTPVGPGSAFRTSYNSVLTKMVAFNPSIKIVCSSVTVGVETTAGGHFTDGRDTWGGNTDIQFLCNLFSANCIYVDFIQAALAYTLANPPLASNQFTQDNLHPTTVFGKPFYGTRLMTAFNPI